MMAMTAASGIPYGPLTARISSASEMIVPSNPSSPRSSPVMAAADKLAGRSPVSSGSRRCPGMMAAAPAAMAAWNGGRSRRQTSARSPAIDATTSCVSARVLPWPGKCLAVAATPADCRPSTAAAACRDTRSGSAPNDRVPMAGFSASSSTSTHGARSTLIPSWARSVPIARCTCSVRTGSSIAPSAALPGYRLPLQ